MARHGDFIDDDSKVIRVIPGEDSPIRVLLHEGLYDWFKPLYDYLEVLRKGLHLGEIWETDWIQHLSVESDASDWSLLLSLIGWAIWLVKKGVSLGKFTYEIAGGYGERYGEAPYGGGTRLLELPVEG